jgi:hypothetical protein
MHFTPKKGLFICGILVAALTASVSRVPPAQNAARQVTFAVEQPFQASVQPAVASDFRTAGSGYIQPVSWYGSKHWWKRNAPIVGGAGGGALIGGLAGGGTGAVIGGAAGGGAGYLYKRSRHHHHHYYDDDYRYRH